jgi:hypothetical protein
MLSKTVRLGLVGKSDKLSDMTLNVLYVSLSSDGPPEIENIRLEKFAFVKHIKVYGSISPF